MVLLIGDDSSFTNFSLFFAIVSSGCQFISTQSCGEAYCVFVKGFQRIHKSMVISQVQGGFFFWNFVGTCIREILLV